MTLRNFGISAHIDAGKTTLAERILFVTGHIHRVHDVQGQDGTPAMDHDSIEARRGISIHAAATTVAWAEHQLNVIDTPGHVDFTIEVERALRVLDGAVLLLDAVAGVQAQTVQVDRQMRRYGLPRVGFINKMDKPGSDPVAVLRQVTDRLGHQGVLLQWPLGVGPEHRGVIDLLTRTAWVFEGPGGGSVVQVDVPASLREEVEAARERMLDAICLHSDALTEQLLEGEPDHGLVHNVLRAATLRGDLMPTLLGSAYRNIGVQPLLDAIVRYLPAPSERTPEAIGPQGPVCLRVRDDAPAVAYVFKVEETQHGRLSWIRVFQGSLTRGDTLRVSTSGRRVRVGRLVRLDAGEFTPVERAPAGDLVAIFGAELQFGDTLTDPDLELFLEPPEVPVPVMEVAVQREGRSDKLDRVLARIAREDPTLVVSHDERSGEIRLRGMGELHLEVVAERLREQHGLNLQFSEPSIALRQAWAAPMAFDTLLRQQNGGKGQYARLIGTVEPADSFSMSWQVVAGAVPETFRSAVERGLRDALEEGRNGIPVHGATITIQGGAAHAKDSSDQAFYRAARMVVRECLEQGQVDVLEPIMDLNAEADAEFQGGMLASVMQRQGQVTDSSTDGTHAMVQAVVPLSKLFGFTGTLRTVTRGTGTYQMQFSHYAPQR